MKVALTDYINLDKEFKLNYVYSGYNFEIKVPRGLKTLPKTIYLAHTETRMYLIKLKEDAGYLPDGATPYHWIWIPPPHSSRSDKFSELNAITLKTAILAKRRWYQKYYSHLPGGRQGVGGQKIIDERWSPFGEDAKDIYRFYLTDCKFYEIEVEDEEGVIGFINWPTRNPFEK